MHSDDININIGTPEDCYFFIKQNKEINFLLKEIKQKQQKNKIFNSPVDKVKIKNILEKIDSIEKKIYHF